MHNRKYTFGFGQEQNRKYTSGTTCNLTGTSMAKMTPNGDQKTGIDLQKDIVNTSVLTSNIARTKKTTFYYPKTQFACKTKKTQ